MKDASGRPPEEAQRQGALALVMMGLLGQVGCVTVVIIVAALVAGLWLDERFGTRPLLTLVLMLGSLPITVYAMVRIMLGGMGRLQRAAGVLNESGEEAKRAGE